MAQRTRHGRPSDKGQSGCPAIGLLWARYQRSKCLLSGRIFHRHRHLSGPDFQDLVRLFPT
jgi:hypothetical protein